MTPRDTVDHAGTPATPLAGVRVLDMTTFLSGPFCTQILGDLGADVIKLEPPAGDSSRSVPPYFVGEDSAYFMANNRNKRSVVVDLKSPDGVDLLKRMIPSFEVVIDNFRPGVLAALGVDVDRLLHEHPRLIWASITGFGSAGRWRARPAYDIIVQALSGVMSITGEPDGNPVRLGIPAGDLVAGLYAAIGLLGTLLARDRLAGKPGRHVEVSMLDCQLAMLSYLGTYALISGTTPLPQGRGHESIPTYRAFTAGDGRDVVIAANTDRMWRSLCAVLDRGDLVSDPRFRTPEGRLAHRRELWPLLEAAFREQPAEAWVDRLIAHDVPAATIRTVLEALSDAEEESREMVVELKGGDREPVKVVGNPIRFAGTQRAEPTYPPRRGEHTTEVLAEVLDFDSTHRGGRGEGAVHGSGADKSATPREETGG